jgi:hypothetical protein
MFPNHELREKANRLNAKLQKAQPKLGFYNNSIGSILNAYREGDCSFEKAKELILEMVKTRNCAELLAEKLSEKYNGKNNKE